MERSRNTVFADDKILEELYADDHSNGPSDSELVETECESDSGSDIQAPTRRKVPKVLVYSSDSDDGDDVNIDDILGTGAEDGFIKTDPPRYLKQFQL